MAEDIDLAAELDSLEVAKGPDPMTCRFWRGADERTRTAIVRNVKRLGHTAVFKHLRGRGVRVTSDGIRDHAAGKCAKCQISPTS